MEQDLTMIIFIGIPASGKTTFYHQHFSENYVHINLDTLHTRNKEQLALEAGFTGGKCMVIDNTNPTVEERAKYIKPAKEQGYRVEGYFFQSKVSDCIERNEKRKGKAKVPNIAIAATSNRLEMPSYAEGFDTLFFVHMEDGRMVIEKWEDGYEV